MELLLLVKKEDQVVNEIESVTNNDKRQLLSKVCFLQEVLGFLGWVKILVEDVSIMVVKFNTKFGSSRKKNAQKNASAIKVARKTMRSQSEKTS